MSRYQKGKTNLDFTEARDSEWQWISWAICKSAPRSSQITMPHSDFYRPDALPAAQPTAPKHWRQHTHPFSSFFSATTWMSRYQKGKTSLEFTEARDSEWQWRQLGHMQVRISLQTDNHASTPPLKFFYRPDALPAAQPTVSRHWRQQLIDISWLVGLTAANPQQRHVAAGWDRRTEDGRMTVA